jgi:trehalose 6-phosphate phosphatase
VQAQFTPLIERLSRENGLTCFEGKMLFEVRPALDVNKGTAFARLIDEYTLDAAIYIGDDVTDADALRIARHLRSVGLCWAVGIGVESEDTPTAVQESADVLVSGVSGVEAFMDWLSNALSASST